MIALVLLGVLACTSAAPHFHHHGPPHFHHHGPPAPLHEDFFHHKYFQDDIFDTRSFWDELRRELLSLDSIVDDFVKHFPSSVSSEGIEGEVYKITIPLVGFEEKDIVVKAKKGVVMIQAVSKCGEGSEKTYVDIRTLPNYVNETGKWTYENDTLVIEFPLTDKVKDETPNKEITTESPSFHSREEMEPENEDTNQNADIGADRGDNVEAVVISHNLPVSNNAVEATTYAVDLKDEVEFVPVRQVK